MTEARTLHRERGYPTTGGGGGETLVAQETGTFRTFLRRHSELPIRNQIGSTVPRLEAGVNPAAWRRPRNGAGRPGDSRLCERTPRSSAGRPRSWLLCAAGRSPAAAPLLQVPAKWRCCAGYVETNRERMPCRQFRDMGCRWGVVESAAACAGPSTAPTPCRWAQGRPGVAREGAKALRPVSRTARVKAGRGGKAAPAREARLQEPNDCGSWSCTTRSSRCRLPTSRRASASVTGSSTG